MPVRHNSSGHWFFRFTYRGRSFFQGGFRTKDQASTAEIRARDKALNGELFPQQQNREMTLSEAIEIWFSTNPPGKSLSSLTNEKGRFALAKLFFENARLKDISQEKVEEFLKELPKLRRQTPGQRPYKDLSAHTRNHYLVLLRALWNRLLERKKYFGENPCKGIQKIRINEARVRYLYESEEKLLTPIVETMPDVFAYYFVALHTGCRIGELLRLKVQDVDLILKRLFIGGQTKNKRSRYVPMSQDLVVFLEGLVEGKALDSLLLPNRGYGCISDNFRASANRAKLRESLHLHDLRHTFAQRLLTRGVPIYKVSKILGHSSVTVTEKHYGHLAHGELEEGATMINGVVSQSSHGSLLSVKTREEATGISLALDLHSEPSADSLKDIIKTD